MAYIDRGNVTTEKNVLHWFRKGLRLHDNPALYAALNGADTFRCIYVLDPWFAASQAALNKWRFLLQSLDDLDSSLQKLQSRLFVIQGQPADVFSRLFKEWNITHLSFEEDPEPFGKERDAALCEQCRDAGVQEIVHSSHTLYNLQRIIDKNNGKVPLTYKRFQRLIKRMPLPERPCPPIDRTVLGRAKTPIADDHDEVFSVPSLDELGFDTEGLKQAVWKGGETEALNRLYRHLERKAWVASFEKPNMSPQSLLTSQTGLSPYLRFGCLSPRTFYWKLRELYQKINHNREPSISLYGQLYMREFFYTCATNNPKFDRMVGNPICLQIPWSKNPEALAKWAEGKTGYPWIDAIMTQLQQEGWVHPLCRHAVACFLTRGDLWISWEEGMKVFDEMMIDMDWSQNAGIWMWLSCSSFFQPFLHTYCPVNFGKRMDPNGDFIRKYLPILKNMPSKYIYEPWAAPKSVQKAAKCIVAYNYPVPMINHAKANAINLERMKMLYRQLAQKTGPLNKYVMKCQKYIMNEPSHSNVINKWQNEDPILTILQDSSDQLAHHRHHHPQQQQEQPQNNSTTGSELQQTSPTAAAATAAGAASMQQGQQGQQQPEQQQLQQPQAQPSTSRNSAENGGGSGGNGGTGSDPTVELLEFMAWAGSSDPAQLQSSLTQFDVINLPHDLQLE